MAVWGLSGLVVWSAKQREESEGENRELEGRRESGLRCSGERDDRGKWDDGGVGEQW